MKFVNLREKKFFLQNLLPRCIANKGIFRVGPKMVRKEEKSNENSHQANFEFANLSFTTGEGDLGKL